MSYSCSADDSQGSVTEKMRTLLSNVSSNDAQERQTKRPKRKAFEESRKNPVVDDSIDDSDTDPHYKQSDENASSSDDSSSEHPGPEPVKPTKSTRKSQ